MRRMRVMKLLCFFLFTAACQWMAVSFAWATASTHIWAPSTDVQPYKKWHITADFYVPTESNADGTRPNTITNAGLTVGVLPFKKLNMEVGFDHKSGLGSIDKYPIYFNAKLGIPEGAYGRFFPAVAVGIYDVGTKKGKTDNNVFYGKVAKSFTLNGFDLGRFSVGGFTGNDKLLVTSAGQKDASGVLVAWERVLKEISDRLWVCVEYQGSQSAYGALNFGFSWKFADNVAFLFGYEIYNDPNFANTFTIQTDIDF